MQDYAADRGVELHVIFLEKSVERYDSLNGNSLFNYITINSEIDVDQQRLKLGTFRSSKYHGD